MTTAPYDSRTEFRHGLLVDPGVAGGTRTEVRDASTGEVLATVSDEGLDLAAVVDYGRTVGQAALGEAHLPPARARCSRSSRST